MDAGRVVLLICVIALLPTAHTFLPTPVPLTACCRSSLNGPSPLHHRAAPQALNLASGRPRGSYSLCKIKMQGDGTINSGLRRPEQWREQGQKTWNQEGSVRSSPFLQLLDKTARWSLLFVFCAWILETLKSLVPALLSGIADLVGGAGLLSTLASVPGASLGFLAGNWAAVASALPSILFPLYPVGFVVVTAFQAMKAILLPPIALLGGALWAAVMDFKFVVLSALSLSWMGIWTFLGLFSGIFTSSAPGMQLVRCDMVFYLGVTLALRLFTAFYDDYEEWRAQDQEEDPLTLTEKATLGLGVGVPVASLVMAIAAGTGSALFGMILAYFLCIAVEYTMVDLLKEEFQSPSWITVKVPFTFWRITQLNLIGPVIYQSLAPLFGQPGITGHMVHLVADCAAPFLSGVWLFSCCLHLAEVPALYKWKRLPNSLDYDRMKQLQSEVEQLRKEAEGLKNDRERIRIDTWNPDSPENVKKAQAAEARSERYKKFLKSEKLGRYDPDVDLDNGLLSGTEGPDNQASANPKKDQ